MVLARFPRARSDFGALPAFFIEMLLSVLYVLDGILVGDGPEWFRWTAQSLSAYLGSSALFLHNTSCLFELLCLYIRFYVSFHKQPC